MEINLLAKHFKDADFNNTDDCPLARACSEHLHTKMVSMAVSFCLINGELYEIVNRYTDQDYTVDNKMAEQSNYDDTIIRTVVLNKK